jgi:Fur family zinc uptake transcriptional regulator
VLDLKWGLLYCNKLNRPIMGRPSTLPKAATELVLTELKRSARPLGAYDLLQRVKKHGVNGSMIVYRALEKLEKAGAVHKVKELNGYVACSCDASCDDPVNSGRVEPCSEEKHHHHHSLSLLAVCGGCKSVQELHGASFMKAFSALRGLGLTLAPRGVIELPVVCAGCR